MTSLLATRRRAEEFARLVDERRQSRDPKIADLLDLVAQLTPAQIEPAPAFRTSLRERLVSAAEELPLGAPTAMPTPAARSAVRPPRVRLVAAAASVALAGGMVGTAAAARTALPGDVLYGLKRGLERTEVGFTSNPESRGRHFLRQAENRLDETVGLVGGKSLSSAEPEYLALVGDTLGDFVTEAKRGGALLTESYQLDRRQAPLVILRHFVAESRPRLEALQAYLPTALQPAYDEAIRTLDDLDGSALDLCPDCGINPSGGEVVLLGADSPAPSDNSAPAPAPHKTGDATTPTSPKPKLDGIPTEPPPGPFPRTPKPLPTEKPGPQPDPKSPPVPNPLPTTPRVPVPLPTELPPTEVPLPLPPQLPLPLPTSIPLPLPTTLPLPLPPQLPLPLPTTLPLPTSIPLPLPGGNDANEQEQEEKKAPEKGKLPDPDAPSPQLPDLPLPGDE